VFTEERSVEVEDRGMDRDAEKEKNWDEISLQGLRR
jgi:hypothetical protein